MITINEYLDKIDKVIAEGEYKDNWQSLSQFKTPSWYKKGRFGIFIHWGVYSVPAYGNEWYPRRMYDKADPVRWHHVKTYGENFEYRQFIDMFNPDKFNADEWVKIFKEAGAKHVMPVCEHHDGIKMYNSELNRWNMMTLKGRDYSDEIKKACERNGLVFLASNHRAEHYWFMNGARKYFPDSEVVKNEDLRDLYGPAYCPPSGHMFKTDKEIHATEDWLRDWLASAAEMIDRLQPSAVYFDWWIHKDEFKPYLKKFLAYYYNRGKEWGKEVTVFYKWGAIMNGCATFDVERGQVDGILPELWQNDTAIAKNSWGYTENNNFKSACDIVKNMIEVVSKNGCYMLNVGPKADGTICEEEKSVLLNIGKWLKINGEAIYDADISEIGYGEGKKSRNGAFQDNKKFSNKDYRFTYKTGAFYVFPMGNKILSEYKIKRLGRKNEGGIRYQIKDIRILGYDNKVTYVQDEKCLTVRIDGTINTNMPICIKVSVD